MHFTPHLLQLISASKHRLLWPTLALILIAQPPPEYVVASQERPFPAARLGSTTKLDRINKSISSHQLRIEQAESQKVNLHHELERIDNQLQNQQTSLRTLQNNLVRQDEFIREKEVELNFFQTEKNRSEEHVKKRLSAFYKMGDIGIINALFSAASLPDLLNTREYFQAMFHHDHQAIKKLRNRILLLSEARDAIALGKNKLLELILQVKNQELALINTRQERGHLLERVKTEEKLYRQALQEIKEAAKILVETIKNNKIPTIHPKKRKIARLKSAKKRRPVPEVGFAAQQGRLPPPAPGKAVRHFGLYKDRFGTEFSSSGINIETAPNTEVKSIFDGKVIFSGTMSGYGEMIIIEHGQQYFSLVSSLGKRLKSQGDDVTQAETIATTGGGGLLSQGLHFEIRQGTTPVDPALWLDNEKLPLRDWK